MKTIKESDLYLPIKAFFIENDYSVAGEVKDVDMVASKDDEHIAIELKTTFNLKLLLQAVNRQKYFDSVYIGIQKPKHSKRYNEIIHLIKRLEIGLITVDFLKSGTRVKVEHHPIPFNRTKNHKKNRAIIKEVKARSGTIDNLGGTTKIKRITAYREASLHVAYVLASFEKAAPKEVKLVTKNDKTSQILYKNFYGWFERIGQGQYIISKEGLEALDTYIEIVEYFKSIGEDLKNDATE